MFILDTNILSAMMRYERVPEVATWMAAVPDDLMFTTSISQAEILAGLAVMPAGRRRHALEAEAAVMFGKAFAGRVLAFDGGGATAYAEIFALRRQTGRPTPAPDLMIAAVARSHGATVVTRDVGGFDGCGVAVVNPWNVASRG